MKEQPLHWLDIGRLDDIPIRGTRRIRTDSDSIAIFRTSSHQVFALEDRCPHAGGPLSEGIVHGNCVTCPLHGWVISLQDGSAQGADQGQVRSFEIKQEGDRLLLALDTQTGNALTTDEPVVA